MTPTTSLRGGGRSAKRQAVSKKGKKKHDDALNDPEKVLGDGKSMLYDEKTDISVCSFVVNYDICH
jgi:hypothetical protein